MKKPGKQRIDQLLVERGLADTRQKAQAMVLTGSVRVGGQRVDKPGHSVPSDAAVEVTIAAFFGSKTAARLELSPRLPL